MCCPGLRHLNLSSCKNITDQAFAFTKSHDQGRPEASQHACRAGANLASVDISGCQSLSSMAIKHLVDLCGPSLMSINLAWTGVGSIALLLLAGLSLEAVAREVRTADPSCAGLLDILCPEESNCDDKFGEVALQEWNKKQPPKEPWQVIKETSDDTQLVIDSAFSEFDSKVSNWTKGRAAGATQVDFQGAVPEDNPETALLMTQIDDELKDWRGREGRQGKLEAGNDKDSEPDVRMVEIDEAILEWDKGRAEGGAQESKEPVTGMKLKQELSVPRISEEAFIAEADKEHFCSAIESTVTSLPSSEVSVSEELKTLQGLQIQCTSVDKVNLENVGLNLSAECKPKLLHASSSIHQDGDGCVGVTREMRTRSDRENPECSDSGTAPGPLLVNSCVNVLRPSQSTLASCGTTLSTSAFSGLASVEDTRPGLERAEPVAPERVEIAFIFDDQKCLMKQRDRMDDANPCCSYSPINNSCFESSKTIFTHEKGSQRKSQQFSSAEGVFCTETNLLNLDPDDVTITKEHPHSGAGSEVPGALVEKDPPRKAPSPEGPLLAGARKEGPKALDERDTHAPVTTAKGHDESYLFDALVEGTCEHTQSEQVLRKAPSPEGPLLAGARKEGPKALDERDTHAPVTTAKGHDESYLFDALVEGTCEHTQSEQMLKKVPSPEGPLLAGARSEGPKALDERDTHAPETTAKDHSESDLFADRTCEHTQSEQVLVNREGPASAPEVYVKHETKVGSEQKTSKQFENPCKDSAFADMLGANDPSSTDSLSIDKESRSAVSDTSGFLIDRVFDSKITSLDISSINFHSRPLGSACLKIFSQANTCLKRLSLSWSELDNSTLSFVLRNLPELESLSMVRSTVSIKMNFGLAVKNSVIAPPSPSPDYPGTWSPRTDCPGSHFLKFPGALPSPGADCPGAWFLRADCPGYNSPGTQPLVALSPIALPWLIPLGFIPLGLIPIGVIPLGLIPLWDIPLGLIPLWVIPLGLILLGVIPLGLIPLGLIPLRAYSSVALSPMAYPLSFCCVRLM